MTLPTVSCIMPTMVGRERFAERAIEYFLRQDYSGEMELIVGRDGPAGYLVSSRRTVLEIDASAPTLGEKRNKLHLAARGEFLCLWDDDDWYAPSRVRRQVEALMNSGYRRCGLIEVPVFDLPTRQAYLLNLVGRKAKKSKQRKVATGTMILERSLWDSHPYPAMDRGHDTVWQDSMTGAPALAMPLDLPWYVIMRHGGNAWQVDYRDTPWTPLDVPLTGLIGADAEWYEGL